MKWTHKSLRKIKKALAPEYSISLPTISRLLQGRDYSLRVNHKRVAGKPSPDRDVQFRYIVRWRQAYLRRQWPDHGVWEQMHQHFADDPDMEHLILDSTVIRAHPCAAGASKKRWSGRSSPGTQSGWFQHQNSRQRRWTGQPVAVHPHDGTTTRHHPSRSPGA
ncbi:MAG: hypothetical protein KJ077_25020 [Anaerolineae bacterium]|nr:hypothetical protein [Anaerolineae bacterium]